MRATRNTLVIILVAGLMLAAVAGCDRFWKTATPHPTPMANIPVDVLSARDTALGLVQQRYPDKAPAEGLVWSGENTTPPESFDVSSFSFVAAEWSLDIWVPKVSADTALYEIDLSNAGTGFQWTGKLDADMRVLESNLNVAVEALVVRETALSHRRSSEPQSAPAADLIWFGERTTPEGSVGYERCQFAAEGWLMVVSYGVDRPDHMLYDVELRDLEGSSVWRCQVDAQGQVMEIQSRS